MTEIRPIPSVPRYSVDNEGNVYGLSGQRLKLTPGTRGYVLVKIGNSRRSRKTRTVHSLVLEAFVGPRPDGLDICHANGVRTDNRLENLRYGTRAENLYDSVRHGTHPWKSKTRCPQGHEYTDENTYVFRRADGRKFRQCKPCAITRASKWRSARQAIKAAV